MKLNIPYIFSENIIPKRCRKARKVQFPATISLTFREVEEKDAPVAFIKHYVNTHEHTLKLKKEYRWYRGKLYQLHKPTRVSGGDGIPQNISEFQLDPYPYSLKQSYS